MEEWRTIPGYPHYDASNLGRIRNNNTGRIRKQRLHRTGYIYINLNLNGVKKSYSVHRLVAAAFLGQCPAGCQVDHIDHNPRNNTLSNLRYVTSELNRAYRRRTGPHKGSKRLSVRNKLCLVRDVATGMTVYAAAQKYNVSHHVARHTWNLTKEAA
jgi:HNH endonuclease/NUMOD4 motif